jgi:uncharacterized protein YbjQ (UPF0145 family)
MLITTGYDFEGFIIEKYIDVISSSVVLGTGLFSSVSASFADLTGTRSGSYEEKLKSGEREALSILKERAEKLDGNGIIGIDIDYTTFGNDVIGVIVSGTVVVIHKRTEEIEKYLIPVFSYDSSLSFNVYDIVIKKHSYTDSINGYLRIKNYHDEDTMAAIIVDIQIEDILGNLVVMSDIIFAVFPQNDNGFCDTECSELSIVKASLNLMRKAYVIIKKIILNDGDKVVEIDEFKNIKNTTMTCSDLKKIREIRGDDVVTGFLVKEDKWLCYCGAYNNKDVDKCDRCGREIDEFQQHVLESHGSDSVSLTTILECVDLKQNAKEIYEYINEIGNPKFEKMVDDLKKIAGMERMYGNMKSSALKKIKDALQ